jgi:hypothetical protein
LYTHFTVFKITNYLSTFFAPSDGANLCRVVGVGKEEVEAGLPAFSVVGLQLGPELVDRGFAVRVDVVCETSQLDLEKKKIFILLILYQCNATLF